MKIFLHDFFDNYNLDLINIKKNKTFIGYPRTGNLAMFYGLLYFTCKIILKAHFKLLV